MKDTPRPPAPIIPPPPVVPPPPEIPPPASVERRVSQQSLAPNTTAQDDLIKHGQRKINMMWETTQAILALMVVTTNMAIGISIAIGYIKLDFPPVLSNTMFLIVGFYFSRTNHTAVGGIGSKTDIVIPETR